MGAGDKTLPEISLVKYQRLIYKINIGVIDLCFSAEVQINKNYLEAKYQAIYDEVSFTKYKSLCITYYNN